MSKLMQYNIRQNQINVNQICAHTYTKFLHFGFIPSQDQWHQPRTKENLHFERKPSHVSKYKGAKEHITNHVTCKFLDRNWITVHAEK